MINPTWKKLTEDIDVQYEGCMSVPSIRGKVERYKNIELTYYNENGEKIVKKLNGFFCKTSATRMWPFRWNSIYFHLVGCSDYKIPQVMQGLGILEYSDKHACSNWFNKKEIRK